MKTIILLATLLFQIQAYATMAGSTPVATPSGNKAIEEFVTGDQVLAGSMSNKQILFSSTIVNFSAGVAYGTHPMIYLKTENVTLIVSQDMLLMKADGTLQKAGKLIPGDQLMKADGSVEPVLTMNLGEYTGSVHHISTSTTFSGSVDGHLIVVNGIVAGDYTLQLYLQ